MVTKDALTRPVVIHHERPLDFGHAREIADKRARELGADPMLLAWYEAKSGKIDVILFDFGGVIPEEGWREGLGVTARANGTVLRLMMFPVS